MSNTGGGIVRYKRDVPPAHFSFKIESFSQLLKTQTEKYETGVFEAGGYKWKLIFYPDGDKKNHGECNISLYVAIEETKVLPHGWEVNVDLKLFVFDQIRNSYLTIRDDTNGGIQRFHEKKTEIGFAQLLPLETFGEESNGYLKDDSCAFGAEIFVINPTPKSESLSLIQNPDHGTFTWTINDFLKLTDRELYFSKGFTVGGTTWKIKVYPKGYDEAKDDFLSVYITNDVPSKGKVYADFKLRVKDQLRNNHVEKSAKHWFTQSSATWGFAKTLPLGNLHEKSKGFVVNGSLIIEAQIVLVSVVKSST